jgi:hypothetical protein
MSEDELRDYRLELYNRLEVADPASQTAVFADAALKMVYAMEKRAQLRRTLRDSCSAAAPEVDADVFVDALFAINGMSRELGDSSGAVEIISAAFDAAQARKEQR